MKVFQTALIVSTLALAACDGTQTLTPSAAEEKQEAKLPTTHHNTPDTGAALANGAPIFATLYPGATLSKPALNANENGRLGGMAEFVTDDSVDDVISHYRQLAESAGLSVVMEMNQGNARAIGARNNKHSDLQIVASPNEELKTSVQITWQAPSNS